MVMRFRPRPEYEGLQGTVAYGSGQTFSIHGALSDGGGVIETDNPHLQQVLSEFQGGHGYVFDVVTLANGEETPAERDPEPVARPTRTPAEAAAQIEQGTAQHDPDAGYALLPIGELRQIAEIRGLDVGPKASQESIIAIIEQHDAAVAAGTGEVST